MTNPKKIESNRKNALKSTGPKTEEGKKASRMNALKHGILSQEILLPGEDESALIKLKEGFYNEFSPVGDFEEILVDRIVSSIWRLKRLGQTEASIFRSYEADNSFTIFSDNLSTLGASFIRDGNGANAFSKLSRYESTIERGLFKAIHELQRIQAARLGKTVSLPITVDIDVTGVDTEPFS
jgi:hypothetical protein